MFCSGLGYSLPVAAVKVTGIAVALLWTPRAKRAQNFWVFFWKFVNKKVALKRTWGNPDVCYHEGKIARS